MPTHTRNIATIFAPVATPIIASILSISTPSTANQTKPAITTTAPPTENQPALTVTLTPTQQGYQLSARTCPTQQCPQLPDQLLAIQPPKEINQTATLRTLRISGNRNVVHIDARSNSQPNPIRWQAFIAAPLSPATEPILIWSGLTPDTRTIGDSSTHSIQITPTNTQGTSQILIGETNPAIHICGRQTLLSPKIIHSDLSLQPVKLQRLSTAERNAAESVTATRNNSTPPPLGQLMVAIGASSAIGNPGAVTDGNPETTWSEGRGKEGRGEFVVTHTPADVPIPTMSFIVRPPTTQIDEGASPKSFYIATDNRLIRVHLNEDAWKHPGASYSIRLNPPLNTSCIAIVLDDAHGPITNNTKVTLSEITAYSTFDGTESHQSLAETLNNDTEQASIAAAILMRGGKPAAEAVANTIGTLNPNGRHLAMQILDSAPCTTSSPVFAAMLASPQETERTHAKDRIRRCARSATSALEEVATHGAGCAPSYQYEPLCTQSNNHSNPRQVEPSKLAALDELASISPERAVPIIAPLLTNSDRTTRASLRQFIARATHKPQGREAITTQLQNTKLPTTAAIDILRATHDNSDISSQQDINAATASAFQRLTAANPSTRTRFLLMSTAARLAESGNQLASQFLTTSITSDPEPMVRTQAATVAKGIKSMTTPLLQALNDENVRVRHAATISLEGVNNATANLITRLTTDDWPLVRAAAAQTLATTGPSQDADQKLTQRLLDNSPAVRLAVATSLGTRKTKSAAAALRTIAENPREKVTIRIAAIHALGSICDQDSTNTLLTFANRAANPYSPEAASGLGAASIATLGILNPPNLRKRLEPVLAGKSTPPHIKAASESAISSPQRCER
ncbi:MAG: HEAT repeat domain-containing protein [Polyangiaceae bacterium]|nr:HEAT repeat domain-containing protein [Polyangiaceae bacterium]